ncbi:hypothetical protein [Streptomyces albus]|uniref:hypothetical protein n=2 Tax=Streptomyces TaxID=1883 RepID=UPI002010AE4A|nr:hypothetical protein [Streptomyces albus]
MMYAIAKNVASPPLSSRLTVEPRSEILKNRSSAEEEVGGVPWGAPWESTGLAEADMRDLGTC